MAERNCSTGAPATTGTFSGAGWYGKDISGQAHTRVVFTDLNAVELVNKGATFDECTFRGARFSASFHGAQFERCHLRGSDLTSIDPRNAGLSGAIVTANQAVMIAAALGLDIRVE